MLGRFLPVLTTMWQKPNNPVELISLLLYESCYKNVHFHSRNWWMSGRPSGNVRWRSERRREWLGRRRGGRSVPSGRSRRRGWRRSARRSESNGAGARVVASVDGAVASAGAVENDASTVAAGAEGAGIGGWLTLSGCSLLVKTLIRSASNNVYFHHYVLCLFDQRRMDVIDQVEHEREKLSVLMPPP